MVTCCDISNTFLQSAGIHCFTISWARGCSYTFVQKKYIANLSDCFLNDSYLVNALPAFLYRTTQSPKALQHCCQIKEKGFLSSTVQVVSEFVHRRILKDTECGHKLTCHTVSQTFLNKESAMDLICLDLREVISWHTYIRLVKAICRHYQNSCLTGKT